MRSHKMSNTSSSSEHKQYDRQVPRARYAQVVTETPPADIHAESSKASER
jgi:hypothetical protein